MCLRHLGPSEKCLDCGAFRHHLAKCPHMVMLAIKLKFRVGLDYEQSTKTIHVLGAGPGRFEPGRSGWVFRNHKGHEFMFVDHVGRVRLTREESHARD